MITPDNWEAYAMMRADGELDDAGCRALDAFLAAHPALAAEAALWGALRAVPDECITFSGKDALLQPEPRIAALPRRRVWAMAASVALLAGMVAVLWPRTAERQSSLLAAQMGKVQPPSIPATAKPVAAPVQTLIPATTPPVQSAQKPQRNAVEPQLTERTEKIPDAPSAPATETAQPLFALQPRSEVALPVDTATPRVEVRVTGSPALAAADESRARLPIDAEKLALLEGLRGAASGRLQALRDTREKLRDADVTVSLGRRELFTVHF